MRMVMMENVNKVHDDDGGDDGDEERQRWP